MPAANAKTAEFLAPSQMACGVKGGLDASVHEKRAAFETKGDDDTWVALSVDACNAFSMNVLASILDGIFLYAPTLAR